MHARISAANQVVAWINPGADNTVTLSISCGHGTKAEEIFTSLIEQTGDTPRKVVVSYRTPGISRRRCEELLNAIRANAKHWMIKTLTVHVVLDA